MEDEHAFLSVRKKTKNFTVNNVVPFRLVSLLALYPVSGSCPWSRAQETPRICRTTATAGRGWSRLHLLAHRRRLLP